MSRKRQSKPEPVLNMKSLLLSLSTSLALLVFLAPARGAEDALKTDLAKMQGKWKGTLNVDEGASVWTLEIKGNKTKVTVKSKEGGEIARVESDFKLEQHGKFRALTYWNLKHLAGDKSGETELTDGKTRSSLYKFDGSDAFSTIGGFREDDEPPHWLIRWEKVKD